MRNQNLFWCIFAVVFPPYLAYVVLFFIQLSFNFLESSAYFTALSFFPVITTGSTELSLTF